jgi:AcrR family transcriptional regulator
VNDPATTSRPRISGAREDAILDAALALLRDVGYDRFTMDAVAAAAHAGKASLYRRWRTKGELVVDALTRCKPLAEVDSGTLRGDLLGAACEPGGMVDQAPVGLMAALMTAMHHDDELRSAFVRRFLEPRLAATRAMFERARARGEIDPDADIELLVDVVPSMVMHRLLVRGQAPSPELITSIVDEVLLPAARRLSVPPASLP